MTAKHGVADLGYVSLARADLLYADLACTALDGANLSEVRLKHAIWIDGSRYNNASARKCVSEAFVQ